MDSGAQGEHERRATSAALEVTFKGAPGSVPGVPNPSAWLYWVYLYSNISIITTEGLRYNNNGGARATTTPPPLRCYDFGIYSIKIFQSPVNPSPDGRTERCSLGHWTFRRQDGWIQYLISESSAIGCACLKAGPLLSIPEHPCIIMNCEAF